MEIIHSSVTWYQQKIGSYDKQLWEQSVEQKVLKGIQQAPRRSVKPKTALIDVDLVRGSTFSKAKPQVPWSYITLKTFSRVVFFPCHYRWWIQQTSIPFWLSLTFLYSLQIFTICVFVSNADEEIFSHEHSLTEVFIPCILMVLLGLIHSQTVLTHLKPLSGIAKEFITAGLNTQTLESWRRKRSLSQTRCSNDLLANNTVFNKGTVGSDGNSSQSKTSLKNATGCRVVRDRKKERTKDRKVRLKGAKPSRSGTLRADHISQDSESAYHTHEDSVVDRGSSADLDSVGGGNQINNEEGNQLARNDIRNCKSNSGTSKQPETVTGEKNLRESQESDLPEDSNSDDDNVGKATTSDKDGSNRFSQSISSDNELDLEGITKSCQGREGDEANDGDLKALHKVSINAAFPKDGVEDNASCETLISNSLLDSVNPVNGVNDRISDSVKVGISTKDGQAADGTRCSDLTVKVRFEGRSHLSKAALEKSETDKGKTNERGHLCKKYDLSVPKSTETAKTAERSDGNCVDLANEDESLFKNLASRKELNKPSHSDPMNKTQAPGASGSRESNDYNRSLQCTSLEYSSLSSIERERGPVPAHIASSVHFTIDKQREISPGSSREGTPTHTQSDVLLQAKRARGGDAGMKSSDSESDTEKTCNTLPNVRRRKVTLLESSEVGGSILRNRRQPSLVIRESKSNPTMVSSSDGETEGQSSEYSREGRKHLQNMASSEEWGDHLQSGLDTTTCSSCGSEPEISAQEVPESETEADVPASPLSHSTASSTAHVINLLHPSSSQSSTHSPPDKVTCIIWEGNECKKIELTAIDIGWAIIEMVHKIPESSDYVLIGITFSILMGLTPLLYHSFHAKDISSIMTWNGVYEVIDILCRNSWKENLLHLNGVVQRLCLSAIFFFMLSVADKTFKQRLLYAKHFCYLTSSRRARKFDMPHFRLNKVRNIRTWLSLRSYLKKRGPQRSVDVIVSSSFLITLIMLILICLQLLRDTEIYLNYLCNWELLAWCMALGVYLLRFMNLGLRINKKYRNLSVLITEQINLYLQMEQKPHKKEELLVANNVLKLAESLLKELESPFKISGISANPLVLNVTRVVVLSAFSAVLTELLGFKLKLYKIKLRP